VPLDFNELRELLAAIAHTDIAEITLKSNDFELTVRKGIAAMPNIDPSLGNISPVMATGLIAAPTPVSSLPVPPIPIPQAPVKETATASAAPPPPKVDEKWLEIKSPMVGTFYRAPAPDEPPYVDIGDRIRTGQIVCIIEAMKLMNEIESEVSGQVMEILVNNGEPVEYGQVLMRINPG
jgi:acetyl-CoA carboxylase biotin carboxyl carrier protein